MQKPSTDIAGFDPSLPIERAWTPPAAWYTTPDFHALEQAAVFGRNWLVAARSDQLAEPGRFVCGTVAGERYVIVRDENGSLQAFYNVCRHHAAAVAEGEGKIRRFVCPYHGWTYGLDGHLINAPETKGLDDFDPKAYGLVPIAVDTWGPLVFIALTDRARPLHEDLAPLKTELDDMAFETLTFVERRSYKLDCNWKVYVDNYLDGGYHVAYLHRGLASQLNLQSYRTEVFERFSIQTTDARAGGARQKKAGIDFAERIGDRALYAWIYPNLMINRYGPIMDTNLVIPLGHNRTEVIFDFYFKETEGADAQEFIRKSIAASDVVQVEDMDICDAVQLGLESRSYDKGRYAPGREMGEYHFHRLLAGDVAAGS